MAIETSTRVSLAARIVVNRGEPDAHRTRWGAFIDANTTDGADMSAEELLDIEHQLFHGLVYHGGGGAAAAFTVERA